MNVIVTYVPTLVRIEVCLKDRDDFYETLEEAIRSHEKKQAHANGDWSLQCKNLAQHTRNIKMK